MILALIGAMVGGLIFGLKTPLISPALLLLKSRKDLFLILFLIYCLALGFEVRVRSVYSMDLLVIFALILPTLLILDTGLRESEKTTNPGFSPGKRYSEYLIAAAILIGWFSRELFAMAILLATFRNFSEDNPRKGVYAMAASMILLLAGLFLGKGMLDTLGSSSSQVVFISALAILIALIFMKKLERHDLF